VRFPTTCMSIQPLFAGWCEEVNCELSGLGGICASKFESSISGWQRVVALAGIRTAESRKHMTNGDSGAERKTSKS